jgi:hypothetical protein
MASGYIAGGAIAGIGIAFTAGVLGSFDRDVTKLMEGVNPFFAGGTSTRCRDPVPGADGGSLPIRGSKAGRP